MYKLLMLVTLLPSLALANAAEDLVAKLQGLESPVSYTHLTLPTIYSV